MTYPTRDHDSPAKAQVNAETPKARRVKLMQIYKYADRVDIALMIVGSLSAILTGVCYPIMLSVYRNVSDNLVLLGKVETNVTHVDRCSNLSQSSVSPQTPVDAIHQAMVYYFVLGTLSIVFYWIAWNGWMISAERQVRRMRFALLRNILRQEIGWFDVHSTGELNHRLVDDLEKIKDGLNEKVPEFISLAARMFSCVIYALIIGWKLSLVFLSVSPVIVLTFNVTIKAIVKYTMKEVEAFASASSIAQEVLQNIRTVTAFHGQQKEEKRFAKNLVKAKNIGVRKGFFMGVCQGSNQIFFFLALTLIFWYGPHLILTDCAHYSPGSMLAIFVACMVATTSAAQFTPNFQNFAEALASTRHVFEVIERTSLIDSTDEKGEKPESMIGEIEFDQVSFTYPGRLETPILNNLSLKIPSGKTVALVGASGCGKSTIIQLIQRFYDPDAGRVLIDGKDLRTLNVSWLRSRIGLVSQEPVLFTGSIEENIRFGKSDATLEEVQQAARMANAHDFIMALPENYKTVSGDKLSGGQKQRVAIARALISNPTILLLDEATSALDNTSERVVQDALDKAKEGRTTIVIAHRLSTIRHADLIIGFDRGQMIEHGTDEELIASKGLYYELVMAQTQNDEHPESADEEEEDDDEVEREQIIRQQSLNRSISKQSTGSVDEEEDEDDQNEPTTAENPTNRFRVPFFFRILQLNAPEWRWILLGSICSLLNGAVQPTFALIFSHVFRSFAEINADEQKRLNSIYAGVIFAIGAASGVAEFLIATSFAKSGEALTMRMRKSTFSALLRQEIAYFDHDGNSVGALVTRLSSDSSALKGLTGTRIGIILQATSAIVIALVIAFSAGWKLALVALCFVPLLMLNGLLQGQKHAKAGKAKNKGSLIENGGQYASQAIDNMRTVVSLGQEKYFIDRYEQAFNQEFKEQISRLQFVAVGAAIANSVTYFLQGTSFAYGSQLVIRGEMRFDQVFRVFVVIVFAMMAVGRAIAMIPDYSKGKAAAIRIMRLNKRQSLIDPSDQSGIILDEVEGNVEFHDVYFRYPSRPTVRILRKFSLQCSAKMTTALVGTSGSGKSTTIALLERFYDPWKGKILLDGHDIKVLNLQWLRSLMGLVQQEPVLFNLSIRENIAYGDNTQQLRQEQIEQAAKMANIHESIISLPQGYETMCGAKGSQLSGGQKQRIAIARALIRSPKFLLLDEATSALDNKSEQLVQAALDAARADRTTLTIAHRLSTIQNSEKIVVVERGRVKEEGTHEELAKRNGTYAKLSSAQKRPT